LYFARGYVGSGLKTVVHTFIKEKKSRTYFDFTNETDDEGIDSVSYDVDVLKFEGEANWVGMFGLTGGFDGRFSNDDAHVPIVAHMKVIIGSVKVQLQDWKREGWIPPRHVED
jgi:elongation factor P hydroxylase